MIINRPKENEPNKRGTFIGKLVDAHNDALKKTREQNTLGRRPRIGTERLSNTDTIRQANAVRRRLLAKLQEVTAANVDRRTRDGMMVEVKMQLDRVDRQIIAIKRRQNAITEEKKAKKDECPRERRRRRSHIKEKSVAIRQGLLYSAQEGGFDPNHPSGFPRHASPDAAVSFAFNDGNAGTVLDAPVSDISMEIIL
jgi:hypothetical protein